jgi:hypothetical protein
MAIVGLGLLLFALLIGNMQNFLQALGSRYVAIPWAYLSCNSIHLFVNELTLPFHGNLMLIISLLCAMAPCLSMEASCNSIHLFVNELTLHFHGNLHIEQWNQLFVVILDLVV